MTFFPLFPGVTLAYIFVKFLCISLVLFVIRLFIS